MSRVTRREPAGLVAQRRPEMEIKGVNRTKSIQQVVKPNAGA